MKNKINTNIFLIIILTIFYGNAQGNLQNDNPISIEALTQKLNKTEPLTEKQYKNWTPKRTKDLKRTKYNINTKIPHSDSTSNLNITYKNDAKEIELIIIDCAKNATDMEMILFAFDMDNQFKEKESKEKKPSKPVYIKKINEEEHSVQILFEINKRIAVSAVGKNMNPEELWEYITHLHIEKLIK